MECIHISGVPSKRQKEFFSSRAKFTAYGGARGGGKSWALRRKLTGLCLNYPGISCLLLRRSLPELKANHLSQFLREYQGILTWSEGERRLSFPNGSRIEFGFCSSHRDTLRYQGQEYDIIAIDEATQLSEYQFSVFKACLRGVNVFPKRVYLTCNPGGIGHAWVKRLFIDRIFREGENPSDYRFIPAKVYDNAALMKSCPEYAIQLESLSPRLRDAWLLGRWDVFEGQFFPEFDPARHICKATAIPEITRRFIAFDYGFDMLAALLAGTDKGGNLYIISEYCSPGLTLSAAAEKVASLAEGKRCFCAIASPDLWNRRQDSGKSGFEIMQKTEGMPPMTPADDRRVPGWRMLREYLAGGGDRPKLFISERCTELIRCLPALLCDPERPEDASGEPHSVTHAPEALRYAVMSRQSAEAPPSRTEDFVFPRRKRTCGNYFI